MKKIVPVLFFILVFNVLMTSYSNAGGSKEYKKPELPAYQQILMMIETDLDVEKSRKGDAFQAKLMEDILVDEEKVLIPSKSVLAGKIIKVQKANLFKKDSFIRLSINVIENPSCEKITLETPYITEVFASGEKKAEGKLLLKVSRQLASSGISLLLGRSSSLSEGAIWGIKTGAEMCIGIISGFIKPEFGKTKMNTGTKRAYNSTILGKTQKMLSKGENFSLESGQFITIYLDRKGVKLLMKNHSLNEKSVSKQIFAK